MEFKDLVVTNTSDAHRWYMTIEQVAKGYGVAENTISTHLKEHEEEIRMGIEKDRIGITDSIVGHVRKTLNVGSIYGTPDVSKVKNVLKNMLGLGLRLTTQE
jgi:predicted transcriptional regulator